MKKKLLITGSLLIITIVILGVMFIYQPHRDVANAKTDYIFPVETLVLEYLKDEKAANKKYLSSDGQSKIIMIEGFINNLTTIKEGRSILILKGEKQNTGMQCLLEIGESIENLHVGDKIKVKGVLRAGPGYDEDLEMYENGYLEKCSITRE